MKTDTSFRSLKMNGVEYLTFAEDNIKTRQSGLHEKHRLVQPKMLATNTSQCPVSFYKLYLSKRPYTRPIATGAAERLTRHR